MLSENKYLIINYVEDLMNGFKNPVEFIESGTADDIFRILTSRKFCYQSKRKVQPLKKQTIQLIEKCMLKQKPITFSYNIGGGYHASLEPGKRDISYTVGLSELLLLYQIYNLHLEVTKIYKHGIFFVLGISNLNVEALYNISITLTEKYAASMRMLFDFLKVIPVKLIVESEINKSYKNRLENKRKEPTQYQKLQIERFIGNKNDYLDIEIIQANYDFLRKIAKMNFSKHSEGISVSQRSNSELNFRSYPGSDSKIQTGEVMLMLNSNFKIVPKLITSKNFKIFYTLTLNNCPVPINFCD